MARGGDNGAAGAAVPASGSPPPATRHPPPPTGQRHAFLARFRVGFDSAGRVGALEVNLYSNAGASLDLSASIMDRALLHADCAYRIPVMRVAGHLCRSAARGCLVAASRRRRPPPPPPLLARPHTCRRRRRLLTRHLSLSLITLLPRALPRDTGPTRRPTPPSAASAARRACWSPKCGWRRSRGRWAAPPTRCAR